MQKYKAWLVVVAGLSPVLPSFAQTASRPVETAHSQHTIVPLSSMSLDGRVSGDPSKPRAEFVIRMYNDANFIVLPHWHPQDEHITVVKGTWYVAAGDT